MLKTGPKSVFILMLIFTLCTCIDPYFPNLKSYESLLVVDGLITDGNASYTVKLSRTIQDQNASSVMVTDAFVFISDDAGNNISLTNRGKGLYKTDSTVFRGTIGKTYILHIKTGGGNEYESDPCLMQSVPEIDSLYFEKDQELVNNRTESVEGIRIYLDSKPGGSNQFYRWDFTETWKFKVPNPKKYDFHGTGNIVPVAKVNSYCWKNRKSDEVLITRNSTGGADHIKREPILFIGTNKSDKIMLEYSVLVRQYSLSGNEYDFWHNLKQVNLSGGDIFASQPYSVISNIHNKNNINERVLGYFQVSAVKQERIFIPFSEVVRLHLPFFHYDQCERIEKSPGDFPWPANSPPLNWNDIYEMYVKSSDYVFIEPLYNSQTGVLEKLVFTKPECADCSLTGTIAKPDFWIDLK
jgi:Domain of unknown function (DUF4249)